jgi:hypothetical protein
MPPITLELTINLATLITVLTGVWKVSAWVTETKAMRQDLEDHTSKEEKHFEDFRGRFHDIGDRIATIQLASGIQDTRLQAVERRLEGSAKR